MFQAHGNFEYCNLTVKRLMQWVSGLNAKVVAFGFFAVSRSVTSSNLSLDKTLAGFSMDIAS